MWCEVAPRKETMDKNKSSEELNITLLEILVDPKVPLSKKCIRARSSPTKIKTLYHLFQLYKNVESGKWGAIYQGKERLSKNAGISKNHLSEFVNSEDFKIFGDIQHRKGKTSIYRLKRWVVDAFHFFEKKGMMKNQRNPLNPFRKLNL